MSNRRQLALGAFFLSVLGVLSYYTLFLTTLLALLAPLLPLALPRPRLAALPWRGLAAGAALVLAVATKPPFERRGRARGGHEAPAGTDAARR